MSIAGISSSDLFSCPERRRTQMQQMRQEFQQLGQDLQSGNLSAAQSDFATLTQLDPNLASSSSTSSTSSTAAATSSTASNPMQQAFAQLAQGSPVRQPVGGAAGLQHHSAGYAERERGAWPSSPSPQREQPDSSRKPDQPDVQSAGPGSAVGQSDGRAAGLHLAAAAVPADRPEQPAGIA